MGDLFRPRNDLSRMAVCVSGGLISCGLITALVFFAFRPADWILALVFFFVLLVETIIFQKRIALSLIRIYQQFAPDKMRKACRFYPSCSVYMYIAIQKYGTWRGILRGLKRILRCRIPNGGVDWP
ncbi:MAG: membrane protein insertion efficiency factor YidD [Treponemataceae bacterium]|nr:membrane protein insertion efficiency factor YidD [Treponemataceae bacterium]